MLVERPELGKLLDEINTTRGAAGDQQSRLNPDQGAVFGYMLLNYSLFERVYLLYDKKWIDEETWNQWHTWLKVMAKHPIFQEVHRRSEGSFDKAFYSLVAEAFKSEE